MYCGADICDQLKLKRVWNSAGLINNCKQAKGESMAAFFEEEKEVTETVEEPQKTVEAAKKEAETVNTEPPATIVCPACGREINKKTAEKINMSVMSAAIISASVPKQDPHGCG